MNVIRADRLHKRYARVSAVTDVSVSVAKGSIVALLGSNGSGKTTTLKMLAGLVRPDGGRIEPLPPQPNVLLLPDDLGFYPHLTGQQNLDLLMRVSGYVPASLTLARALDAVGLGRGMAGRAVAGYSQGERRRLGLALALLRHPALLLLDEPTGGLDIDGITLLRNLVGTWAREGAGVLMASHELSEIERIADHVVLIRAGRTIWSGTLREVRERGGRWLLRVSPQDAPGALTILRQRYSGQENILDDSESPAGLFTFSPQAEELSSVLTDLQRSGVAVVEWRYAASTLENLYHSFMSLQEDTNEERA